MTPDHICTAMDDIPDAIAIRRGYKTSWWLWITDDMCCRILHCPFCGLRLSPDESMREVYEVWAKDADQDRGRTP